MGALIHSSRVKVRGVENSVSPGKGKGTQKGTLKFWSQEPGKRG